MERDQCVCFGLIGRGARLGAEKPGLWAIQIVLSLDVSGRRYRGRNAAFNGLRSKLASTNLDERIDLLAIFDTSR
jgi:hypothetical protein